TVARHQAKPAHAGRRHGHRARSGMGTAIRTRYHHPHRWQPLCANRSGNRIESIARGIESSMSRRHSKVIRASNYRWEGIPLREYKSDGTHFKDITRQTLMGEGEGEEALTNLTRYFEIQPGGYSTLERHEHTHAVIILRGRGEVILEER